MQTVDQFVAEFSKTEGHDCSGYEIVCDLGTAAWAPSTDELFVEYDFEHELAVIRRRRTLVNPTELSFFR